MRLLIALLIAFALFVPQSAAADELVLSYPPSKGHIESGDLLCTGETHQDGHHWKLTDYIPFDREEMASDSRAERDWQIGDCAQRMNLQAGYWYQRLGLTYDPGQMHITYKVL